MQASDSGKRALLHVHHSAAARRAQSKSLQVLRRTVSYYRWIPVKFRKHSTIHRPVTQGVCMARSRAGVCRPSIKRCNWIAFSRQIIHLYRNRRVFLTVELNQGTCAWREDTVRRQRFTDRHSIVYFATVILKIVIEIQLRDMRIDICHWTQFTDP